MHFQTMFLVNAWKRYGQKLHSIIMLQFEFVTLRFAYGRDRKPIISMISAFSDVSLSPKTNFIYLWRPQDTSNNSRKLPKHSKKMFRILECLQIDKFGLVGKDGGRKIPTIRPINSCKSWRWDQYLPENMKWIFGKSLKL